MNVQEEGLSYPILSIPMQALTIKEVSRKLMIPTHTLRFWEKELEGILVPKRTSGGQRRYTLEHLMILTEIKRMKSEGFSLYDIKCTLENENSGPPDDMDPLRIDLLANCVANAVRLTIYRWFRGE
jgi:DNA-binding transcriptional MerR regulator